MADSKLKIVVNMKDNASKGVSGLTKNLGTLGKVGATVAAAGLAAAAAGVIAVGAGLAKLAIDAAPIEGIKNAFEGLTNSMEGGSQAMLSAMQEQSAGMITNTDLMKTYNLASQLVGEQFATQLPEAMGYLAKVSAATGEDMTYMMDSIVRGVGRMSPMILDNLGIQVDLTQANKDYAEQMGINVSEMTKQEQQTALMNQVMVKLKENTALMPEVVGTANQQFEAMKTRFSNLKDELGLALLPAFSGLLEIVADLADKYLPVFVDFFMDRVIPAVEQAVKFIGGLVDSFGGLGANIGFLQPLLDAFGRFWDEHGPRIKELAGELFEKLIEAGKELYEKIMPFILDVVEEFADWLDENGPLIEDFAEVALKAFGAIADSVVRAYDIILPLLSGILDLVLGLAKTVMQVATGDWAGAWETIQDTVDKTWGHIKEAIAGFVDWVLGFFDTNWDEVVEVWKNNWKMFVTIVETLWSMVVGALEDFIASVQAFFEGVAAMWWEIGKEIVEGIKQGVSDWWGSLVDLIAGKFRSLLAFARKLLGMGSPSKEFWEMGEAIVKGLLGGFEDNFDALYDAIETKFDDIADLAYEMADEILKAASVFGQLGSELGKRIEDTMLVGYRDRLEEIQERIEWINQTGWVDPGRETELGLLLGEQRDLREAIANEEARMLALEKQRADLAFLQDQMKLLNMIDEFDLLPGDILGDLTLGLGADLGGLMDAMIAAMTAALGAAETELIRNEGTTTNEYNLTINESGGVTDPLASFEFLQAVAG